MTEPLRRDHIKGITDSDQLPADLLALLEAANITDDVQQQQLMMQLVSYIVRRDHKIFNHAYQVGRASA